jgi:hypothetical protein
MYRHFFFSEGCDFDVSSFVSEGADPSTMSSPLPDISLFDLQLYALPEAPAEYPLLPQT